MLELPCKVREDGRFANQKLWESFTLKFRLQGDAMRIVSR